MNDAPDIVPAQFIPPWMDSATLCRHICISMNTVEAWVSQGILPAPRMRGGKRMWKWAEVDRKLTVGEAAGSAVSETERIENAARSAAAETRARG